MTYSIERSVASGITRVVHLGFISQPFGAGQGIMTIRKRNTQKPRFQDANSLDE